MAECRPAYAASREAHLELVLIVLIVALLVLILVGGLLVYQLILQSGRTLLRLEALEELLNPLLNPAVNVEAYVPTLPKGVAAPPFTLPDLNGVQRSLSEWRGSRVLLVFFDPNCVFSRQLLPSLVALGSDVVPGRPQPIVVSTGSRAENRALFDEADASFPVLLQAGTEIASAYKVDGTPMSYLVSADGAIAGDIAVGIQAILILAGEMADVSDASATYTPGLPEQRPPLMEGVTVRDGLRPGATAPVFRLPRLDGGELSLLNFRGRDVVLVFWDPECAPCDELAPLLEKAHGSAPDLALLMISRGEIEETRAKAAEFGLTFPIVVQRHREISREYGIFETPAAYFIDEWGTIGANVAVSPESIMELINTVAKSSSTR